MKILVTGASGNVGRYLVAELLQQGEQVIAASTDPDRLTKMFTQPIETVYFDFTKPETFAAALKDVDRVFLMRSPHLGRPEDLYPFIDALTDHPLQLVSFLSLMGIEKNPIPPHYKIEKYLEAAGLPYAHLRPGFFMQNVAGIHAEEIKKANQIFIPAGNSRTSFIDARDIGLAAATLLHNYEAYPYTSHTITGSEALSYTEVAEILSTVTGRKITYAKPGFLKYRNFYLQQRGLDKDYVHVTVALYFMTRMGTAKAVTDDFFRLTGQQPRTFAEFAREHQACFL